MRSTTPNDPSSWGIQLHETNNELPILHGKFDMDMSCSVPRRREASIKQHNSSGVSMVIRMVILGTQTLAAHNHLNMLEQCFEKPYALKDLRILLPGSGDKIGQLALNWGFRKKAVVGSGLFQREECKAMILTAQIGSQFAYLFVSPNTPLKENTKTKLPTMTVFIMPIDPGSRVMFIAR